MKHLVTSAPKLAGLVLLFLAFQNCAPFEAVNVANLDSSSLNLAEKQMIDSFSSTLHPALITNCASCHSTATDPLFAADDPTTAFRAVRDNQLVDMASAANSAIVLKLEGGHRGISAAVTTEVSNSIQAWINMIAADVIPPSIAVNVPANANQVSGQLTLTAVATDNLAVTGVQFYLDGAVLGAEVKTSPYSVLLNSVSLSNGAHIVMAKAFDAAGNETESAPVTLTVNNAAPDTVAPVVTITAPLANANVTATIPVTAIASDTVGVAGVQFFVDNVASGAEDLTAPYSIMLDTTKLTNGNHNLTARARDAAGNMRLSGVVTVTVTNALVNPNATYTYIAANILPKCTNCHGANKADGGVRYNTHANTIRTVVPNNLNASEFYTECNSGSMPLGGNKLNPTDLKAIADWINTGALNN